jgi:CubicO group peptidase (beta-lactamase class C family)/menaquinone-dependent protoporphyrinogen IX oxidase
VGRAAGSAPSRTVVRSLRNIAVMKPFLIVYATREGQTQRVAEHVAATLRAHGAKAQVLNATEPVQTLDLADFGVVVLAASVHMHKHEREMIEFVKARKAELLGVPTVFLSISLSQAAVENAATTEVQRARAHDEVEQTIDAFFEATDFQPSAHKAIAGALVYTKYNWLIRLIMKQIAKAEGASAETSSDHEYTDWIDLDRFVHALLSGEMPVCASDSPGTDVSANADSRLGARGHGTATHHGLHIEGSVSKGFEPVRRAFIENFTQREELGGACCIYHEGEKVVDLWGGVTARATRAPWHADTMAIVYSTTKGLAAMVMALAHSRGWLDYDQRVSAYWPEFSQAGKAEITVRQVLAHQAGLFAFDEHVDRDIIGDPDRLAGIMARQRPAWPPGERQAYHAISLGFYEGELIRRVDPAHRTLGQVFDQEIARPLGLDAYIRVPRSLPSSRVSALEPPSLWERLTGMPLSFLLSSLDRHSVLYRSLIANPGTQFYLDAEQVIVRELEVPSGGGIATARALAKAYGVFATGGHELGLRSETLEALKADAIPSQHGFYDECLRGPARFSLGFMKPNESFRFGHPGAFGAPGAGGSMGYADPDLHLGYGYVTSRMGTRLQGDPRDIALREAIPVLRS